MQVFRRQGDFDGSGRLADVSAPLAAPDARASRRSLPQLFLDVDGVLNPYAWRGPKEDTFADFTRHVARGFTLLISREMGVSLGRLPVEICWATTWADTVDEDVAPHAGLPPGLRVAARPPGRLVERTTNWKLVQVRALVEAERRPFAWLDDDALDWPGPDGRTPREWAAALGVPNFLLAPRPERGLTRSGLARLERWVAALDGVSG